MTSPILALADLKNRDRFGELLNDRCLTGQGVEVGTHRGDFADLLLSRWKGFLHCVDPWSVPEGYEEQAQILQKVWETDGDRDHDLAFCKNRLRRYTHRIDYMRTTSVLAARLFRPNTLDFVYVDGDHRTEMVRMDLDTWYERVKPGGILAGHDLICPGEPGGGCSADVQAALFPFAIERGLIVHMVAADGDLPWSYYLEKPK